MYAYYPGVDSVAHEFGLHDRAYRRELAAADQHRRASCSTSLPDDVALLVTADHGQVHLERESWIDVPALAPLTTDDGRRRSVPLPATRARARTRNCSPRRRAEFGGPGLGVVARRAARRGDARHGATGSVPGRIGDVVLAARDAVAFVDPALPNEAQLRSGHGSLTPDEMLVPLLAARGRA